MKKNINPLYLEEVSRKYYDKIFYNSEPSKIAIRNFKKISEKNPSIVTSTNKRRIIGQLLDKAHTDHVKKQGRLKWFNSMPRLNYAAAEQLKDSDFNLKDKVWKQFRKQRMNSRYI